MRLLRKLLLFAIFTPLLVIAAAPPFEGRWKMDKTRSTALDGWHEWDLVINIVGSQIRLQHDMKWGRTNLTATNTVDTAQPAVTPDFFRVEQRHMALYPGKGGTTTARASWLDEGRTIRIEADTPIEISQGQANLRLYQEYRLIEGDTALVLIELHNSRPQPLVYRFNRVKEEK